MLEQVPEEPLSVPHVVWIGDPLDGGDQMLYSPPDTGSAVTLHLCSGCIVVGDKGAENNSAPSVICVLGPLLPPVIPLLLGKTVELTARERVRSCSSRK